MKLITYLDIRDYPPEEYRAEVLDENRESLVIRSERDDQEMVIPQASVLRIRQSEEDEA